MTTRFIRFSNLVKIGISLLILGGIPISSKVLNAQENLPTPSPSLPPFQDVNQDPYLKEIQQAVERKLMSGFPQQQFRPQQPLTREQLVSVVIELFYQTPLQNINLSFPYPKPPLPELPKSVDKNPFPDVDANRWSASKIQLAREIGFIRGYKDGLFRPEQAVTRAELMSMLWEFDKYMVQLRGWDGRSYFSPEEPLKFSDIRQHWAKEAIERMSANCRVASPLNETGTTFAPNQSAKRNYVAAASIRSLSCLSRFPPPPS